MKRILLLIALLLIIIGGVVFAQNYLKKDGASLFKQTPPPTVTIDNHNFKVVVASSPKSREIGLSETKSLPENQGMIFLFDKPDYYSFWMKDMKFSIDIIYINNDTIVTIKNNVAPPKDNNKEGSIIYTPTAPVDKVLEIQAGLSEKYKFKTGDKVKYENLGN